MAIFTKGFLCTNVLPNSDMLVADLVAQTKLVGKTRINTDSWSTPLYIVDSTTPKVPVSIVKDGVVQSTLPLHIELQKGVPMPTNVKASLPTNGDCHLTIIEGVLRILWEYIGFKYLNGIYQAEWGGIIDNIDTSDGVVQPGPYGELYGATATSISLAAGLIRYQELQAGKIPHMLSFAIPNPKCSFIPPALRTDAFSDQTGCIPAGQIFKFPLNISINPAWCPMIKMIVIAVRDYGMFVRDRSASVCFYAEDPRIIPNFRYDTYYGGKQLPDVMLQFPWDKLQAVRL